jgi:hypothetical protein
MKTSGDAALVTEMLTIVPIATRTVAKITRDFFIM